MSKALHIWIDNDSDNKNDDYDDDRSENKTKQNNCDEEQKQEIKQLALNARIFIFRVQFCDIFRLLYNHWRANNQIAMKATTHSLGMN